MQYLGMDELLNSTPRKAPLPVGGPSRALSKDSSTIGLVTAASRCSSTSQNKKRRGWSSTNTFATTMAEWITPVSLYLFIYMPQLIYCFSNRTLLTSLFQNWTFLVHLRAFHLAQVGHFLTSSNQELRKLQAQDTHGTSTVLDTWSRDICDHLDEPNLSKSLLPVDKIL